RLTNRLRAYGYTAAFHAAMVNTTMKNCAFYGDAVFVLGTVQQTVSAMFNSQAPGDASRKEYRGYVCARTSTLFGMYVGCSVHLSAEAYKNTKDPKDPNNGKPTYAEAQADEAIYGIDGTFGAWRRIVGGDFNLHPTDTKLDIWYSQFIEADTAGS